MLDRYILYIYIMAYVGVPILGLLGIILYQIYDA